MAISKAKICWDAVPEANEYLVRYRKTGDTDWITPSTSPNPTTSTCYDNIPAQDNTGYDYNIISKCDDGKAKCIMFSVNSGYLPVVIKEFSPLRSPTSLVYNPVNKLVYAADYDGSDANKSLYYFNPATAQSPADFTYVSGSEGKRFAYMAYSGSENAIYVHGPNSQGLYRLDCATNILSAVPVVPYNTLGDYGTGFVYVVSNKVLAYALIEHAFIVYNIDTGLQEDTFRPTNYSSFDDSYIMHVGSQVWVHQQSSPSMSSRIAIYNENDLTTQVASVENLSESIVFGQYRTSLPWYDEDYGKVWYMDYSVNKIKSINTTSHAISEELSLDPEDHTNVVVGPIYHPTTNRLYFSGRLANSTTDPGNPRIYLLGSDRSSASLVKTIEGSSFYSSFIYVPDIHSTYASNAGVLSYMSPNTGYDTDGKIVMYN